MSRLFLLEWREEKTNGLFNGNPGTAIGLGMIEDIIRPLQPLAQGFGFPQLGKTNAHAQFHLFIRPDIQPIYRQTEPFRQYLGVYLVGIVQNQQKLIATHSNQEIG